MASSRGNQVGSKALMGTHSKYSSAVDYHSDEPLDDRRGDLTSPFALHAEKRKAKARIGGGFAKPWAPDEVTRASTTPEKRRNGSQPDSQRSITSPLLGGSHGEEPPEEGEQRVSSMPSRQGSKPGPSNYQGLKGIFLHGFCLPLICVPLGIASGELGWGNSMTFWLNFLGLIPLAKIVGDATEELAACLKSDTMSGLLNATFGNAVEMIVAVQSIRHGLFNVVKASLLGSVLSNILLVLGSSFVLGGLSKRAGKGQRGRFYSFAGSEENTYMNLKLVGMEKEQKFPVKSAMMSMAMLLFACMTVVLPTIFSAANPNKKGDAMVLQVSRIGACVSMSAYVMYLLFQLLTHKVTLALDEQMKGAGPGPAGDQAGANVMEVMNAPTQEPDDAEEDEPEASLSFRCSMMLMLVTTAIVSWTSEYLVNTVQEVAEKSGIPMGFIGVVLLPIAGNACEHASALRFCWLDRPGLAIGIAVGSSTQVALLVVPFSVMVGQAIGQPLDMDYGMLNVGVLTFSVLVVSVLLLDGRSNWFKGYILLSMYIFIATLYWCLPPDFGDN